MSFLFQIYVEKNLCGEILCGEKMTNMRSALDCPPPSPPLKYEVYFFAQFFCLIIYRRGFFLDKYRVWICAGTGSFEGKNLQQKSLQSLLWGIFRSQTGAGEIGPTLLLFLLFRSQRVKPRKDLRQTMPIPESHPKQSHQRQSVSAGKSLDNIFSLPLR